MLIWAVVAFGLAILLVVVEAFMPSGGIIGALAGVCAIVGIVLFFRFDTMWGLISMALTLLSLPFLLMGLLWVWPNTPVGRALTLDDVQAPAADTANDDEGAVRVGQEGTTITDLRPRRGMPAVRQAAGLYLARRGDPGRDGGVCHRGRGYDDQGQAGLDRLDCSDRRCKACIPRPLRVISPAFCGRDPVTCR